MIQQLIEAINKQQKGKENTPVYYVGEQLKDICRQNEGAAEIVLQDLKVKEMSIAECEKKIAAYARKHGGCTPPDAAEKIIREFYGINKAASAAESKPKIFSLADLL